MIDYNIEDAQNHPDDFKVYHHAEPKKELGFAFIVVEVLPEIVGLPWCHATMLYTLSLDPCAVRVTTGMMTCDAVSGRITVYVDDKDIITSIKMERKVGLPGMCGQDLSNEIKKLKQQ